MCPVRCGAPGDITSDPNRARMFFNLLLQVTFPSIELSQELIEQFTKMLTAWESSLDPKLVLIKTGPKLHLGYQVSLLSRDKIQCISVFRKRWVATSLNDS